METEVLIALLLITGLAAVIPVLAKRLDRFGVPIVVYEIIAGIIVGASGLNLIEPSPILTFLAEFGFAFLMFLVGLELDFTRIEREGKGGIGTAAGLGRVDIEPGTHHLEDSPVGFGDTNLGAVEDRIEP